MTLPARSSLAACPPVGEETRSRLQRAGADDEPLVSLGEGEVLAPEPAADGLERASFELVPLAAVLPQLDRAVVLDDGGEETARPHGRELVRVAEEDRLPARLLDEGRAGSEDRASRPSPPRR